MQTQTYVGSELVLDILQGGRWFPHTAADRVLFTLMYSKDKNRLFLNIDCF